MQLDGSLWFQKESRVCVVVHLYLLTSMYQHLSIRSSLFIISYAKLLNKLVKILYFELSFQITCILPNLSMSNVILKQLLQVFSPSLKFLVIIKSWEQSLHFVISFYQWTTLDEVFQFLCLTLLLLIFYNNIKSFDIIKKISCLPLCPCESKITFLSYVSKNKRGLPV